MTVRPRKLEAAPGGIPVFTAVVPDFTVLPVVVSPINRGPFGLYLATDDGDAGAVDRRAVAKSLIFQGCRSFWFCGDGAASWEDATDDAAVAIYAMAKDQARTVPHDLYASAGAPGGITTAAGTLREVVHFFHYDDRLPPYGPLTARIFVTRSPELESRVFAGLTIQ
jgi:hypothetical protein